MNSPADFDIVCVGGGLGGASLAKVMAARGYRVLVLERTDRFQDRVRGEATHPWGTWEAQQLGLYDLMVAANGMEIARTDEVLAPGPVKPRDNVAGTEFKLPRVCFCHEQMQERLAQAAEQAGATVMRGASVTGMKQGGAGSLPAVTFSSEGKSRRATARLVVGADGRSSQVRKWAGFDAHVRHDPPCLVMAGVLLSGTMVEKGASYAQINCGKGRKVILLPQGDGRVRAYLSWHVVTGARRLQGAADFGEFVAECIAMGTPPEYLSGAAQSGPLATFDCNETWVECPYKDGVALIGDAAGTSDPTWGQGLALTMRDARVLAASLSATEDWEAAGHAWAREHDRYAEVIRDVNHWYAELFMDPTPAGDAKRRRALPRISEDPSRVPQHHFAGPDLPWEPGMRARFFGEA
jgi:menaquinone-9 beta-reductase